VCCVIFSSISCFFFIALLDPLFTRTHCRQFHTFLNRTGQISNFLAPGESIFRPVVPPLAENRWTHHQVLRVRHQREVSEILNRWFHELENCGGGLSKRARHPWLVARRESFLLYTNSKDNHGVCNPSRNCFGLDKVHRPLIQWGPVVQPRDSWKCAPMRPAIA